MVQCSDEGVYLNYFFNHVISETVWSALASLCTYKGLYTSILSYFCFGVPLGYEKSLLEL